MLARKLQALNAPYVSSIDIKDNNQFKNLIIWIEDQKIRHYKIEDRVGLRSDDEKIFTESLIQYLKDLRCPYEHSDKLLVADWLLGLAIRLTYGDKPDMYRACRASKLAGNGSTKDSTTTNPLEQLDMEDPAVKAGVVSIASLLNIPPHHDHKEVLKAICTLMRARFPRESADLSQSDGADIDKISLDSIDLGFSTADYVTDEAVKILRLLHINSLRDLQTKINEALVSVQKVTADPKTDQRLGKIGR